MSQRKQRSPLRPFAWMLVASLLFGLLEIAYPVEIFIRDLRNEARSHPASADIVFVAIDDKSMSDLGSWPWPRSQQAMLINRLTSLGAKSILYDINMLGPSTPAEDRAFETALQKSGRVTLPVRSSFGIGAGSNKPSLPFAPFQHFARLGAITVHYDFQGSVWSLDRFIKINGREYPTFATVMSGLKFDSREPFRIDYSIDPKTVPTLQASRLILDPTLPSLAGKTVIVGEAADRLGDVFWFPGYGRMPGPLVQILGAHTLRAGPPKDIGWVPGLLLASLLTLAALRSSRRFAGPVLLAIGAIGVASLAIGLDRFGVSLDITPALFLVFLCGSYLGWRRFRERGLVNIATGLPNLEALRTSGNAGRPLVAVRIHNYAEVVSAMAGSAEAVLVEQVVKRLRIGHDEREIFQGDEGIFGWFAEPGSPIGNHLEALHALFRQPVSAGGGTFDLAVSFGVELGSGRALPNRFGSALVAADEAWQDGLRWKYHDPARLEEANWRLSLLSQLDAAIDHGEVWVAFQPQVRIDSGETIGAEALARWTHPEKGPISPSEFVAAAEAQDRIAKLTHFVLDRAVAVAASINQRGVPFMMAVNLSARMLAERDLPRQIEEVLERHGLPAQRLTLELTETAALDSNGRDLAQLDALRALGVRLAIDDYGTGLSTLEYLKKVPANELKIDQSFVKAMRFSRSDRLMVQSTISLAHSLGRAVIAEGVEDRPTLEMLGELGCDIAQGFVVGRPMGVRELIQRLLGERRRKAA